MFCTPAPLSLVLSLSLFKFLYLLISVTYFCVCLWVEMHVPLISRGLFFPSVWDRISWLWRNTMMATTLIKHGLVGAGLQFRGLMTCPHSRKQGRVQADVVLELAKGSTSGSKGSSRREGATRTWFTLLLWKGHSYSNQATPNNATPYETIGAIFIKTTMPSFWVSWLDSGLLAHIQMPQPIEPSQWPMSILLFCAVPAPLFLPKHRSCQMFCSWLIFLFWFSYLL